MVITNDLFLLTTATVKRASEKERYPFRDAMDDGIVYAVHKTDKAFFDFMATIRLSFLTRQTICRLRFLNTKKKYFKDIKLNIVAWSDEG